MPQDLDHYLSEIKTPRVKTPEHQKKLRKALMRRAYFEKQQNGKFLRSLNVFSYLQTMSFKKILPAGIIVFILFALIGRNYLAMQNTVYAQQLISETTEKIKSALPVTEKQKELLSSLQMLEELKTNGEIKYLGEDSYQGDSALGIPSRKIQKFRFTNPDLSRDIIITFEEPGDRLYVYIDSPFSLAMTERFDLEITKDGTITNLDALKQKLKDPNVTEPWLKDLIKVNNTRWIEMMKKFNDKINDQKNLPETMKADQKRSSEIAKKVISQLEPLIENAEVLFQGGGSGYFPQAQQYSMNLSLFSITNQKAKDVEAQAQIRKGIEKLSQFKTESAEKKIQILEKALASSQLRYYSGENAFLSFPYSDARDNAELYIGMDFQNTTEDFITITFQSEALSVIPGQKGEWVDVEVQNGHIANMAELQQKLQDPNLHDDLLLFIIRNENHSLAESIKKYELSEAEKAPTENPNLTPSVANELEQLLDNAEVPVIDRSVANKKKNVLYDLGIYPLGKSHDVQAAVTLDAVIDKLKASINAPKEAQIEFLRAAQTGKDLRYEGEIQLPDGRKGQKVSFSKDGKHYVVLLDLEKGEYQVMN